MPQTHYPLRPDVTLWTSRLPADDGTPEVDPPAARSGLGTGRPRRRCGVAVQGASRARGRRPSSRSVPRMMKLTVLYSPPAQVEEFDAHYAAVHVPLALQLPDLLRAETSVVVATPDGSAAPYHRIADLYWTDAETMQASLGSEQGQATAKDAFGLAGRTGSTVTMLVTQVDPA